MKKLFIVLICFINCVFLYGCTLNNIKPSDIGIIESEKNQLEKFYGIEFESSNVYYDYEFKLDDKLRDNLYNANKLLYLIDYGMSEKYYCGYIPQNIINQVEEYRNNNALFYDKNKGTTKINNFLEIAKLFNIDFAFDDIVWKVVENKDEITYSYENNYNLYFIYKGVKVNVIEDIYGNKINKELTNYIRVAKMITSDEIIYLDDFEELPKGQNLVYCGNIEIYNKNNLFNEINIESILYSYREGYRNNIYNKVELLEDKLVIIEKYQEDKFDEFMQSKYGELISRIEELVVEENKTEDGYIEIKIDYNEYKNFISVRTNEIMTEKIKEKENEKIDFLLNNDILNASIEVEIDESGNVFKIDIQNAGTFDFIFSSNDYSYFLVDDNTGDIIFRNSKYDEIDESNFSIYLNDGIYYFVVQEINSTDIMTLTIKYK